MFSFKRITNLAGITVLALATIVYYMTVERTGSLWDCGEFILGAYKLQVVHPPGAGFFVLIGRMFTWVAQMLSDNPADIAFSINFLSGLCSALAAMLICWITMIFGKVALVGRENETSSVQNVVLGLAGTIAGLTTAFTTTVWFSAVEGEVYAMSTFFTTLTLWSAVKWYNLNNDRDNDRWLIFSTFVCGLSIGVHLLSLLAFPAIALLYYFKKYEKQTYKGIFLSMLAGLGMIFFFQKVIIVGIPTLWENFELFTVNTLGLPINSGIVPTIIVLGALSYFLFKRAYRKNNQLLQNLTFAATLVAISYSVVGVIVIRANADTPVNMNVPSDPMRLLPYLNREQYGERPLLYGPTYVADQIGLNRTPRYGRVGNEYKLIDEKYEQVWKDSDKILFPRIGHQDKADLHEIWRDYLTGSTRGKPGMEYNLKYMFSYQMNWMYWRYFYWNFAGRQNADQGTAPWNKKDGNWLSGINAIDSARLYPMDNLPPFMKENKARNTYYFIPFILGILGMIFQYRRSKKEFFATLLLFLLTGLGLVIYSNSPPIEPRERDYALVGSFITFCIWVGMGVLFIYDIMSRKVKGYVPVLVGGALGLAAPYILLTQNWNDHDRSEHFASRDYAANFLNSLDSNAIIFTYGDNDTYPLWYTQEVENVRRDVRVVNLSLIQVDWYIEKLRSKVNDSPAIKMSIPSSAYLGKNLNQVFFEDGNGPAININDALKTLYKNVDKSGLGGLPRKNFYIPVDKSKFSLDSVAVLDSIPISVPKSSSYITKDDLAIWDLLASNINDRPIYFSVTCKNDKLQGLNDYMQLEGLGLRLVPSYTKSDQAFNIYGSGRVQKEKCFDIMMNRWKWGNFDKHETFVDGAYMAAVQSMKLTMLRTAFAFLRDKQNDRAIAVVKKYFESFPNMNFRYDAGIIPFINLLINAKGYEEAKKEMRTLAANVKEEAAFYEGLNGSDIQSFSQDVSFAAQSATDLVAMASKMEDAAFEKEMKDAMGDIASKLAALIPRDNR